MQDFRFSPDSFANSATRFCLITTLLLWQSALGQAKRPNVLFILTDDQSISSLSCYGGRVPTPHLDELASQGARFTNAYVMPQCTPTRAALLTGQHTARNGMWHVIRWYGTPFAPVAEPAFREELLPEQARLTHRLRAAGYVTGMAGKWHLTSNDKHGSYTHLAQTGADAFGFDEVGRGNGNPNEGEKWVNTMTDYAIQFMVKHQQAPWFFYLSHHTLHGKVSAPSALVDKYLDLGAPAEGLGNATYLAAIEHLDTSIGRLLKTLEETNQAENTMVVFLSDNGGVDTSYNLPAWEDQPLDGSQPFTIKQQQFDSDPLRAGKGSPYEGGIRVPCIVRWPAKIEPHVSQVPIHVVDWFPTILEAAGSTSNQLREEDGLSLLRVFQQELQAEFSERSLFWYMPLYDLRWLATPCAVIRQGDWKLIEYFGDWIDRDANYHIGHRLELYNLAEDLTEEHNLADTRPQLAAQLQQQLHQWIQSQGAVIPAENPHHEPQRALEETRTKPPHFQPYYEVAKQRTK